MEKLNSGEVKMTSRNYFILKWLTMFITTVFFGLVAIYIFAYIVFLFVDSGIVYIPIHNFQNLVEFIVEIPWTLVFLGCLSVFLFSRSSKTFYKIYKKPFLTFFFSIIMIILLSHIIFVKIGLMKLIKEEAYREHLQLVPGRLLEFRDSQTHTLFNGYVVATTTHSVFIQSIENETLEIIPGEISGEGLNYNNFLIGSHVNAYGIRDKNQVMAKSIEIVE